MIYLPVHDYTTKMGVVELVEEEMDVVEVVEDQVNEEVNAKVGGNGVGDGGGDGEKMEYYM